MTRTAQTRTAGSRPQAVAQAHRLRLCQELQLDALRLSFTTALLEARAAGRPDDDPLHQPGMLHRPWRRWMVEDLDRALDLAAALAELSADAGPVGPGADRPGRRAAAEEAAEDLVVHYRTIQALLREVLEGVRPLEPESVGRTVRSVLERTEQRIHDLGGRPDGVVARSA